MFFEKGIIEYTSILKIFKSYDIPSYIAIPKEYNNNKDYYINNVRVLGIIGFIEYSVDEGGEIVAECSISEERNDYLSLTLRNFLFTFSDENGAYLALDDIAIYHMDYLATEFFEAFNIGDYPRALCYVKAFEQQYYSVINTGNMAFADIDLANYIVSTIPIVEYKCEQEYNTPTE